ncbi:hypothetical protein [Ottowia sp.]|uniref:hypothetical protein n=1 Tax=Ottowia sp. TaxID=1898956 RepID=UPI002627BF68|nr:hypothetical protein [Ottowia sp.]
MNEPHKPALAAKTHPLGVANARRGTSHVYALRLDRLRFAGPFGRAEFIHTF